MTVEFTLPAFQRNPTERNPTGLSRNGLRTARPWLAPIDSHAVVLDSLTGILDACSRYRRLQHW